MRQCERCGAGGDAEEAICPRCGHDISGAAVPAPVVEGVQVAGGVPRLASRMAGEGNPKGWLTQPWITLLGVGGVILGGVAGFLTGENSNVTSGLGGAWGRGIAGATLGF